LFFLIKKDCYPQNRKKHLIMDLISVKEKFESPSLEDRIDFLDHYTVEKDTENKAYFIETIGNLELTSNHWYNALIIELATTFQIKKTPLVKRYLTALTKSNHKLVKLMLLDYVTETYASYEKKELNQLFLVLNEVIRNRYDRLIVRNQALLLLILIFPDKQNKYSLEFKKNLKRTKDYRSHLRSFYFIAAFLLRSLSKEFILDLISITASFEYGRAVDEVLVELKVKMSDQLD
jgi:hypothetical protein